jgi:hypothetical protein
LASVSLFSVIMGKKLKKTLMIIIFIVYLLNIWICICKTEG